jgi:hypothetical protein
MFDASTERRPAVQTAIKAKSVPSGLFLKPKRPAAVRTLSASSWTSSTDKGSRCIGDVMSKWSDARIDAERALTATLRDLRPKETTVTLAWCETQDALDALSPQNGWPVAYHQIVTRAAQRILLTRGAKVNLVPVSRETPRNQLGPEYVELRK